MKLITPTLLTLLAAGVTALPNTNLTRRSVEGSINFFKRHDCQNECVEIGMCLAGQVDNGMDGSADDWVGWDDGCWNVPEGANSVALDLNNGHKITAIGKRCKRWKDDGFQAQTMKLKVGDYRDAKCNPFYDADFEVKALYYHW